MPNRTGGDVRCGAILAGDVSSGDLVVIFGVVIFW